MRISDWSSDVCSSDLESVTVNSAETANDVNAKIGAAQAAPDRNIAITISTKGEVVSPGSQIILAPAAGQGDGKIAFSNAGSIGAVDKAGAVTDTVGVLLNGSSAEADNTLAEIGRASCRERVCQ